MGISDRVSRFAMRGIAVFQIKRAGCTFDLEMELMNPKRRENF
jgi:hypothetical protein